jgi:alpha-beta hydrolase superfamily lysophospholipase
MARKFFDHDQFNFELQFALGGVHYGAGDIGEMLSTADRVIDGDADSWCQEWIATGERVAAIGERCAESGHPLSARAAYLRAATYYAIALSSVDGTKEPGALLHSTFPEHRHCFDAYPELLDPPADRVDIPYEGGTMPGYLFRPSISEIPRRTLIMNNGSDGPVTSIWPPVSAGGLARGYNVLIFDGPGQQSMLFERDVPFRHDWEHVITPVVDFLLARTDVDPARIVLYGISQGGYWVPRALAFEHRIAAAIADPGVFDVFAPWAEAIPPELLKLLDARDQQAFDQMFNEGMQSAPPAQRQNWEWRAKPYGLQSPYDVFTAARRYNLADVVEQITTPLLITDPEGEQFWPGQSQQLFEKLQGTKQLITFTAAEGADRHCEPMARSLLEQRMYDWLDETLSAATS